MKNALERRQQILEVLCERRHESVENLAYEFGVHERTIRRDIENLSLSYPIYTTQGVGGGVYIMDGFKLGRKYLNSEETLLLEKLLTQLKGNDRATMTAILKKFKEAGRGTK